MCLMENKNFKKQERILLSGRIPLALKEQFDATIPDGVKAQFVVEVIANLWVSLPEPCRRDLLTHKLGQMDNDPLEMVFDHLKDHFKKTVKHRVKME